MFTFSLFTYIANVKFTLPHCREHGQLSRGGRIQDFSRGGAKLPDIIIWQWVVIHNTVDREIFAVV